MTTRREFLLGSAALATGLLLGSHRIATRLMAAPPHSIPLKRQPNILFFFPDQHRHDWTGLNPNVPMRTPNFNALARRGVVFSNAVCPSPLCSPSRAALARGLKYDRCEVPDNNTNMPDDAWTFYRGLRDVGYNVGSVGKLDLRKDAMSWGDSGRHPVGGKMIFHEWGFTHGFDCCGKHDGVNAARKGKPEPYWNMLRENDLATHHNQDYAKRPYRNAYEYTKPTPLPEDAYVDNWIGQSGLDLLRTFDKNAPWFLQVNFNGPHEPMDVTERMRKDWEGVEFPAPHKCTQFDRKQHTQIRRRYAAMIENIDRWLGLCLGAIEARGELDNTIIIYSADHGEMLGDHDMWMKKTPWHPSTGVPLLFCGPGIAQGNRIAAPCESLDIAATCLDYAGGTPPGDWDSRTLRPVLEGRVEANRDSVTSGYRSWRMVQKGNAKLVVGYQGENSFAVGTTQKTFDAAGEVRLYDLAADPDEDTNLAQKDPVTVAALRRLLPMAGSGA